MTGALTLADVASCLEGIVPSAVATCSADGTPNVTWLSIVHRLDDTHVGLSFQFFNKTRENLRDNPRAQVLLNDPNTGSQFRMDVLYERTELDGPRFERVRVQLEGIASQTGMSSVFRLRGLDVYSVLAIERMPGSAEPSAPLPGADLDRLEAFSARVAQMTDLDSLVSTALGSLAGLFGYGHSFLLAADEAQGSLFTVGSHGFEASGVGSDVRIGEGLIGVAAKSRVPVRITNMTRQLIYARAVRASEARAGAATDASREIPLPGLEDVQSQLAMPLVAGGRLVGVVCLQSATAGRFQAVDEQVVAIAARQLAAAMLALSIEPAIEPDVGPRGASEEAPATVRWYAADDSVFIDDRYLIKGVAGRVLWRLLSEHAEGRGDFSNKELRLDPKLGLPGYRDNLEARLVLLRRRLEEQCAFIRLVPTARGRFRLVVTRALRLEAAESAER